MEKIEAWYQNTKFYQKNEKLAKLVWQVLFFIVFSEGVTIFQYLVFTFLPRALGTDMAAREFMWPRVNMDLFGVQFVWSLFGYDVLRGSAGAVLFGGGLGGYIGFLVGSFLAQVINFPLQRNITFKSKGNACYQAMWYLIAWVGITIVTTAINNLWKPIAAAYVSDVIYNILVTVITGGVSMVIFFFVFKIIFPEGEAKKE